MADSGKAANREGGFIIVAVLWILAAMATLASVYAIYVANAGAASHVADDRLQADASIQAGLELAAYQLTALPAATRPLSGSLAVRLGGGKIGVAYLNEGGRIDLNAAPKELLAGLFAALGVSAERASGYTDRIVAWRKKGDLAGQNDEAAAYKAARVGYAPRQARFPNVMELALVRDIPPEIVAKIMPFVTVFNGRAEVNAASAPAEVLAALPGVTPDVLKRVLDQRARDPKDAKAILAALGPAATRATIEPRAATRVWVDVELPNGRHVKAETVILILEGADEPYRILAWHDDFDGPI